MAPKLPLGVHAAGDDVVIALVLQVALVEHHQAIGIFEGQRFEDHAAHYGEQRHVGADAQRHDQHGDHGEAGRTAERADAVPDFPKELLGPAPAPLVARLLPQ